MKPPPVSESRDLRDDVTSARNNYSSNHDIRNVDNGSSEDETCSPGGDTSRSEMQELLKQWLPLHSLPDAIEIVDNIPFTKHGKFLLASSVTFLCFLVNFGNSLAYHMGVFTFCALSLIVACQEEHPVCIKVE